MTEVAREEDYDSEAEAREYALWRSRAAVAAAEWSESVKAAETAIGQVSSALRRLRQVAPDEVSDDCIFDAGEALGAIRHQLAKVQRIADAQAWRSSQRAGALDDGE